MAANGDFGYTFGFRMVEGDGEVIEKGVAGGDAMDGRGGWCIDYLMY